MSIARRLSCLLLVCAAAAALAACGSSGSSTDSELARQQELAAARRQAARDARQSVHIKELERRLGQVDQEGPPTSSGATSTATPPSSTTPAAPAPSKPTTTGPKSSGDWPGGSGYTAVLASRSSASEARATQLEATSGGLDAGVLYSSEFSSLRPGYWVVFSGTFAEQGEAAARAQQAREQGYSDAYPRFVVP